MTGVQTCALPISAGLLGTFITTPIHEATVTVAHAAGTKTVTVTGAGVIANQFEDGWLIVTEGTGTGEMYKVRKNAAADGSDLVVVELYDGLSTAWATADTDVDLYPNPYNGIIVNPVDAQQFPTVLTPRPITAKYHYWAQVRGWAALICEVGTGGLEFDEKRIMASLNTAGEGYIDDSPASQTANTTGMHIVGSLVKEQDLADSNATLIKLSLM